MKIIKYGKVKPTRIRCDQCEAVLEYLESDLKKETRFDRRGESYFFRCPVCEVRLYIRSVLYE